MTAGGARFVFGARMTDLEAVMWRLGQHRAELRSTMTLVVGFDAGVAPGAVRRKLSDLVSQVPRLRCRVVPSRIPTAPPRWQPDPEFDLSAHLRRGAARGGGPLDPLSAARDVMAAPFATGRPPWRAVFVPDAQGAPGSALVLHAHHSYTDGLAGLQLAASLFDAGGAATAPEALPPAAPEPAAPGPAAPRPAPAGGAEAWADLADEMEDALRLLGRFVPWAIRSLSSQGRPSDAVGDGVGFVLDQLAAAAGPTSPAMAPRSSGVVLRRLTLSLPALRAARGRLGATVNDVFLSGLLGGLALYHEKHSTQSPSLRLGVPVSTRPPGAPPESSGMHNQIFGAVIRGPLAVRDFDERTRLVHEMMLRVRASPLAGAVDDLAAVGRRVPGVEAVLAVVLSMLDVVASNVAGLPPDLYLGGARVSDLVPFGPRSGAALNATLLSYGDRSSVGLNIDPASVADPEALVDCLRAGFEDCLGPEPA